MALDLGDVLNGLAQVSICTEADWLLHQVHTHVLVLLDRVLRVFAIPGLRSLSGGIASHWSELIVQAVDSRRLGRKAHHVDLRVHLHRRPVDISGTTPAVD